MNDIQPNGSVDAAWLQQLAALYASGSEFHIEQLQQLYHSDAVFVDPVHRVSGLHEMRVYFRHVYANLLYCQFRFLHCIQQGDGQLCIVWEMDFRHPRLRDAALITVPGVSHLQLHNGRIRYHRDYYDVGAMLYDNLPLLGRITRWLKRRLTA